MSDNYISSEFGDAPLRMLERLRARFGRGAGVEVGLYEGITYPESSVAARSLRKAARVVDVATFHEYGARNIPARPFMKPAAEKNAAKYNKLKRTAYREVLYGEGDLDMLWGIMGQVAGADIKREITNLREPPLAASTIARRRKGKDGVPSTNPLVDTGLLRSAVTYEVVDGTQGI